MEARLSKLRMAEAIPIRPWKGTLVFGVPRYLKGSSPLPEGYYSQLSIFGLNTRKGFLFFLFGYNGV
jgi:hypothetical protein